MGWESRLSKKIGALIGVLLLGTLSPCHANKSLTIGVLKAAFCGDAFIAQEKGYFAAEGLDAHLKFFDAGQSVPVGIVSGDLDFGVVAPTGAFYSLAAQGVLRIIAGNHRDVSGFKAQAIAVTQQAYNTGLKGYADIGGHSFATSTIGSPSRRSKPSTARRSST